VFAYELRHHTAWNYDTCLGRQVDPRAASRGVTQVSLGRWLVASCSPTPRRYTTTMPHARTRAIGYRGSPHGSNRTGGEDHALAAPEQQSSTSPTPPALVCRHRQRARRAGQPEPANHAPTRDRSKRTETAARRLLVKRPARDPAAAERIQISLHL
jgi:hypothetical protein